MLFRSILTDVSSTKGLIHREIENNNLSDHFIGGHPMTGSEKTGYIHSSATLLENAYYVITPSANISKEKQKEFVELITNMHALPILLEDVQHDNITAAISHLPHIIAACLVNLIQKSDDEQEHMHALSAGGFKDITRIASSSSTMWENI